MLDTGDGKFIPFEDKTELQDLQREHPRHGGDFVVDQEVKLKRSRFRVKAVKETVIHLELLSR